MRGADRTVLFDRHGLEPHNWAKITTHKCAGLGDVNCLIFPNVEPHTHHIIIFLLVSPRALACFSCANCDGLATVCRIGSGKSL
jgi:hypothetical protein